jgi:hypothetical protein
MAKKNKRPGMVYVVSTNPSTAMSTKADDYKVGWTRNIDERLMVLQIGCPKVLHLIASVDTNDRWVEHRAHQIMTAHGLHTHGEWYHTKLSEVLKHLEGAI